MAHWEKVPASKSEDVSSVSGAVRQKERTNCDKLSSDLYESAPACVHTHTYTQNIK